MTDFIWRVRAAYWFLRRLGFGWIHQVWYLAGVQLEVEKERAEEFGDPMEEPRDAVDEELSCWSY